MKTKKRIMKKSILLIILFLACLNAYSQTVNKKVVDTDIMEVWAFEKPLSFSIEECYFIDYGQKKFRPNYMDHKSQAIYDDHGNKFKKGEWLSLYKYLRDKGWEKTDERNATIGSLNGRVITFER